MESSTPSTAPKKRSLLNAVLCLFALLLLGAVYYLLLVGGHVVLNGRKSCFLLYVEQQAPTMKRGEVWSYVHEFGVSPLDFNAKYVLLSEATPPQTLVIMEAAAKRCLLTVKRSKQTALSKEASEGGER